MESILVFLPAVVSGTVLVHLLWPAHGLPAWVFKFSLGIGIGLGLRSLQFFLSLLLLPGTTAFFYIEAAVLLSLVLIALRRPPVGERARVDGSSYAGLGATQRLLLLFGIAVFVISLAATANYLLRRRQGDWDAWMMYNRTARFLYYDQAHWRESFSPRMDPLFHADYPLLLASNVAAGWDMLGRESAAVPMLQSALFALGCVGLVAGSLALTRSVGQAALGVIILWGIPVFVNEGARQMADVPMAFFMLATGALLHLYVVKRHRGLLVLAGMAAGLAAWTKNEGMVLAVGAAAALAVVLIPTSQGRQAWRFAAGLALPLAVTLYFKLFLAPSGDILTGAGEDALSKAADLSRHAMILNEFWAELGAWGSWRMGGWTIGILPLLIMYCLAFRTPILPTEKPAYIAGVALLAIQALGYYAAYVVTPYELGWHLNYSAPRILLQMFPLALFLILSASRPPELVLSSTPSGDHT